MKSGWLIFLAMVFDALDGYVARLSRTASDFGAQLDSLCDLVTFGVAPAFLLVKMCPHFAFFHREAVWVIAASYAACAALRLARFNVETSDEDEHLHFSGLPSPAAAAAIAGFAIMFYHACGRRTIRLRFATEIDVVLQIVLPFFALMVALLMVSRIPYPHVVNQVFRGQRTLRPRGGGDLRPGGGDGDPRLFDPHHLLCLRVLRPATAGLGEDRPAAHQEDSLF